MNHVERENLLHLRGGWGLVTVAHIAPTEEEYENCWKHKFNSVSELHDAVGEYAGCENVWVGLNRSGARRVVKVRYLCAVHSDRDFHNISDRNVTINVAVFHLDASLSSTTRCRIYVYSSGRGRVR